VLLSTGGCFLAIFGRCRCYMCFSIEILPLYYSIYEIIFDAVKNHSKVAKSVYQGVHISPFSLCSGFILERLVYLES
jgi:hypothetical protein